MYFSLCWPCNMWPKSCAHECNYVANFFTAEFWSLATRSYSCAHLSASICKVNGNSSVSLHYLFLSLQKDYSLSSTWYIDIFFYSFLPRHLAMRLDAIYTCAMPVFKSLQFLNSAGQWQVKITFFIEHNRDCSREWKDWVWCCHGNG